MEEIIPVINRIRNAFGDMPAKIESLKAANASLAVDYSKMDVRNMSLTSSNLYLESRIASYQAQIAAFAEFADEVDPPDPVVDEDEDVDVDADPSEGVEVVEVEDGVETVWVYATEDVEHEHEPEPDEPDEHEPMAPEQDEGEY